MSIDAKSTFSDLTLNVITRMIAGKKHYGEDIGELGVAMQFKEIVKENFELSGATKIGDFVPATKWIGLNNLEKRLAILHRKGDEFVQDLIPTHRKVKESASDQESSETMIDVLLTLQETEPEYYVVESLDSEVFHATKAKVFSAAVAFFFSFPVLIDIAVLKGGFNIHGHEAPEKFIQIVARLRMLCCTKIVTVGLAKERAKKKKEPLKEEPKKKDVEVAEWVKA
ncbi:hypothetical protein SADUNF_Sadunf02G0102300 [Salix dunnii]|uniref:Uncharacterized protein n=1 Tax=Salix dunnii TaxID=1413687 RepID=A0A835N729_9ROSI|nr:hypothetical protein SADUNF_Sadunf02G0102300 [Salix dunnii]